MMPAAASLAERLEQVRAGIAEAAAHAGRSAGDITLVAVSKTVPPHSIVEATRFGVRDFGENYVQEAEEKISALSGRLPMEVRWHMVGHLQTNKARVATRLFDIIETVDSLRVAEAINRHAGARIIPVLLEVQFGEESGRFGFRPDEVAQAVAAMRDLRGLSVQGLMTVPPLGLSPSETRRIFERLRRLQGQLASTHPDVPWEHLSMGMSDDYQIAIEEGATMVRIGRAIFGERPSQ